MNRLTLALSHHSCMLWKVLFTALFKKFRSCQKVDFSYILFWRQLESRFQFERHNCNISSNGSCLIIAKDSMHNSGNCGYHQLTKWRYNFRYLVWNIHLSQHCTSVRRRVTRSGIWLMCAVGEEQKPKQKIAKLAYRRF